MEFGRQPERDFRQRNTLRGGVAGGNRRPVGKDDDVRIATGAGLKSLRLLDRHGHRYSFEMNMGRAEIEDLHATLVPGRECVILNVGNPQCAVFAGDFDFDWTFDWRTLGAELERHPRFPHRTNVSFIRVVDEHTLDVRFFERGAGETMSSGTGSTGAAAAALARGWVRSPVNVLTPAGPLELRAKMTISTCRALPRSSQRASFITREDKTELAIKMTNHFEELRRKIETHRRTWA